MPIPFTASRIRSQLVSERHLRFRHEKTPQADWLLYGCFLSIEAEKHARDGKSRKAPHCQIELRMKPLPMLN